MDVQPVKIFISYSHEDAQYHDELVVQLNALELSVWSDREIPAGGWHEEIERELEAADIILLLVSAPFLSSSFIKSDEIPKALERHDKQEAVVIPILVRTATAWRTHVLQKRLQAVPRDSKWVAGSQWSNRDEAWDEVAGFVYDAAQKITQQREQAAEAKEDAKDQYRQEVQIALADDVIEVLERRRLDKKWRELGLTEEEAAAVEADQQQTIDEHHANLTDYRESIGVLAEQQFPLSEHQLAQLDEHRAELGLKQGDVAGILDEEIAKLEAAGAAERREEEKAKKEEAKRADAYRLKVEEALATGRISRAKRQSLKAEQEALGISDEDAAAIKAEVLADAQRQSLKAELEALDPESLEVAPEELRARATSDEDVEAIEAFEAEVRADAERKKRPAEDKKAAAGATDERVDTLTTALSEHKGGSVFVRPKIPDKKLGNVRTESEIPSTEEVLAIVDLTVMGSAKDHWAFTGSALYYKYSADRHVVPYDDLRSLDVSREGATVSIGEMTLIPGGPGSKRIFALVEAVKKEL